MVTSHDGTTARMLGYSVPDETLKGLTALQSLDLTFNSLTGTLPGSLA